MNREMITNLLRFVYAKGRPALMTEIRGLQIMPVKKVNCQKMERNIISSY